MHSPDQTLKSSRDETRKLLLKALHRANDRQQAVARRRTNWRIALRMIKWSGSVLVGLALLALIAMQAGYEPGFQLMTDQELERLLSAPKREQGASVGVRQMESAQPTALAASSPASSATPEQAITPPVHSEHNDANSPLGLKAESQLNSLLP